jgi:hypothetical protein
MSRTLCKCKAAPINSVPEAPIVAPALTPPIESGYCWPPKVKTPLPPDTPKINPALKILIAIDPVAASAGVMMHPAAAATPETMRLRRVSLS